MATVNKGWIEKKLMIISSTAVTYFWEFRLFWLFTIWNESRLYNVIIVKLQNKWKCEDENVQLSFTTKVFFKRWFNLDFLSIQFVENGRWKGRRVKFRQLEKCLDIINLMILHFYSIRCPASAINYIVQI